MYKVLDVREYKSIGSGSYHTDYCGVGGKTSIETMHFTAVICQDLGTNERKRFDFYYGYKDDFLGKTKYYGYRGDYVLLVPGDLFEIKETSTYDTVVIHYT